LTLGTLGLTTLGTLGSVDCSLGALAFLIALILRAPDLLNAVYYLLRALKYEAIDICLGDFLWNLPNASLME